MKILLVEDEPTLNQNIRQALLSEGMAVDFAFDGLIAERLFKNSYDCLIVDINLPGKNGYELSAIFRALHPQTPILMLTAFAELDDKVRGFEAGADDYLTKPFFMKELLLRIRSLVKRTGGTSEQKDAVLVFDDIKIDTAQKKVTRQDQEVLLTPREYQILLRLCADPGEMVSKSDLIKEIWGRSVGINTNTIEVYINFLRNKIDKPFNKNSIKTKIGFGYYIQKES